MEKRFEMMGPRVCRQNAWPQCAVQPLTLCPWVCDVTEVSVPVFVDFNSFKNNGTVHAL